MMGMLNPNYGVEIGATKEEHLFDNDQAKMRLDARQEALELPSYRPKVDFQSWDDAIDCLFRKFDKDSSGFVDSRELRSLAARLEGISMRRNLRQALHVAGSIMERMAEGVLLSREDFGKHVQSMLSGLPEEDVALFVSKVLDEEEVGVIEDQKASLITNTCIPVLREALMDMFRGVERFHMDTAAGTNLEDGYLPRNFKHFNPLKHLGRWLSARSRVKLATGLTASLRMSKESVKDIAGRSSRGSEIGGTDAASSPQNTSRKLELVFETFSNSRHKSGKAAMGNLMRLVKLGFPATPDSRLAEELGLKLDTKGRIDPNEMVDFSTFSRIVRSAQSYVDKDQAEAGVRTMAKHLEDAITEAIEMAETSEGGTEGTPGANTPTSKPGTPNQSARSLHSPVP